MRPLHAYALPAEKHLSGILGLKPIQGGKGDQINNIHLARQWDKVVVGALQ